jgi:pimeloyl-ACP methyl ester carboxylesterase
VLASIALFACVGAFGAGPTGSNGFAEQRANVNGVNIAYTIGGSGPVVVLLHGFAQTRHMWAPLLPRLAPNHTVIAPDLRGAVSGRGRQDRADGGVSAGCRRLDQRVAPA